MFITRKQFDKELEIKELQLKIYVLDRIIENNKLNKKIFNEILDAIELLKRQLLTNWRC